MGNLVIDGILIHLNDGGNKIPVYYSSAGIRQFVGQPLKQIPLDHVPAES